MTPATVLPNRRFAQDRPCPVCGGFPSQPRGTATRCHGFLSGDGRLALCTREDHAGRLSAGPAGLFAHRLEGPCGCGSAHAPATAASRHDAGPRSGASSTSVPNFIQCAWPYPCDYVDARGRTVLRVCRWTRRDGQKTYSQFRPTEDGGFARGGVSGGAGLYRLPEILAASEAGKTIHVVEGEKKVHLMLALGFEATCNAGGAGKWRESHVESLRGAGRVVVWADNDEPGRRHARKVVQSLRRVGVRDVRVPNPSGLKEGEGIDDWLDQRRSVGTAHDAIREELSSLVDKCEATSAFDPTLDDFRFNVTRLSQLKSEPVEWIWPGWIPAREVTIIDGDPGLGKSTLGADLAARLSRGQEMPDGSKSQGPAGTVLLTHEDDYQRVVLPRLRAAGADLDRIATVQVGDPSAPREIKITAHELKAVEAAAIEVGAKLILIDPLMAYLPGEVNMYRDHDVRRGLLPLRDLARRINAAVVVVRHLTKNSDCSAIHRGGGSVGIIAGARSALLLAIDPNGTKSDRVLAVTKNNLAPLAPSLTLRLVPDSAENCAKVEWSGVSQLSADDLLRPFPSPRRGGTLARASDLLREVLASGPVRSSEVDDLAVDSGISLETLKRAKKALGVRARKLGQPGQRAQHWEIELPDTDNATSDRAKTVGPGADDPLRAPNDSNPLRDEDLAEGVHEPLVERLRTESRPFRVSDEETDLG